MKPFDLQGLKTYELHSRPSKVFVEDLGRPLPAGAGVADWLDALPRQLAADALRKVRDHLLRARQRWSRTRRRSLAASWRGRPSSQSPTAAAVPAPAGRPRSSTKTFDGREPSS